MLVAGANEEGPTLYLAANGCDVIAIDREADVLERVYNAAAEVGLTGRIRGLVADLASWSPDIPLTTVVCAAAALAGLSDVERRRAFALLQGATTDGGVAPRGDERARCAAGGDRGAAVGLPRLAGDASSAAGRARQTWVATKHVA